MEPLTLILLGAGGYYVWKKNENPEWHPLAWLLSSPFDKTMALERVKVASVPTPASTVALDPGMSTDQVKAVNDALKTETDPKAIKAQAEALDALGHESSAGALHAKAQAVGEAKAKGATEAEIHKKQIEAQAPEAPAAVGWGPYAAGFDAAGADSVFGTHSYGYPFGDVAYGYSYHPEHFAGIQSGPAIVGIQSGPAIVGMEGHPGYAWPEEFLGYDGRRGFGRGRFEHGRFGRGFGRGREGWERFRHHRRRHPYFQQPEQEVEEPMPEQPVEEIEVPEEHRRHFAPPPPPPPPPPPQHPIQGIVTSWEGDTFAGWEDEIAGVASYGGGGLVAEYPGVPQQAQPYGQPVGQYQQQYYQQPVEEVVEQPQYYQQYYQPEWRRGWGREFRRGGWGRGWGRRW